MAQPNPNTVLVVYNSTVSDSQTLANYYASAVTGRNIPAANMCPVAFADPSNISYTEYTTTSPLPSTPPVRTQIRNCLNSATDGAGGILYIVMAYMTPYQLIYNGYGYALDSFLSDIWDRYTTQPPVPPGGIPSGAHGYYFEYQSQGMVYKPYVSFSSWRAQPRNARIYSVWRLDADTLSDAEGLVSKALAAETLSHNNQLTGVGCFDMQLDVIASQAYDGGYLAEDWDLYRTAQFVGQAGFTVISDTNNAEFGTSPAPARCDNALLYSGWYSLDHYNDAFSWNTGAIGFHADSNSASNPRGGPNWSANAIIRGITVTAGSLNEPYLEGLTRPSGTYYDLLQGANVGDAFLRNTRWLKWQIMFFGDPLYTPFAGGKSPFNPPASPLSFSISPRELVGGWGNTTGQITLGSPAPSGGVTINLSAPAVLQVPSTVTVPFGSTQVSFTIGTGAVQTGNSPQIQASFNPGTGPQSIANTMNLDPALAGVLLAAGTVRGGQTLQAEIFLNQGAPIGGAAILVNSSNPSVATVPDPVVVPAGHASVIFNVNTSAVGSNTAVNLSVSFQGTDQSNCGACSAALTVTP